MSSFVEVTRNGHVLEVKLNKPKVNAIDQVMRESSPSTLSRVGTMPCSGLKHSFSA